MPACFQVDVVVLVKKVYDTGWFCLFGEICHGKRIGIVNGSSPFARRRNTLR